jgi:hypothetical protein
VVRFDAQYVPLSWIVVARDVSTAGTAESPVIRHRKRSLQRSMATIRSVVCVHLISVQDFISNFVEHVFRVTMSELVSLETYLGVFRTQLCCWDY